MGVAKPELLRVDAGEYSLSIVGDLPQLWPPGAPSATQIAVEFVDVTVKYLGRDIAGVAGSFELPRPIIGENSTLDVYLSGPAAGSLEIEPRSDDSTLMRASSTFSHYRITYRGAVGVVRWNWRIPVGNIGIEIESFPSKLDYRSDYKSIVESLKALSPALAIGKSGSAGDYFNESPGEQRAEAEWLANFRAEWEALRQIVERLLPRLRVEASEVVSTVSNQKLRGARLVSKRDYRHLQGTSRRVHIPAASVQVGAQTPLNGYLRWELESLFRAADGVRSSDWFSRLDSPLQLMMLEATQTLSDWLRRTVGIRSNPAPASLHTRLRDSRYGAAFRKLRRLRWALEGAASGRLVGVKDLPTLYEYWVFLAIVQMLRDRFGNELEANGVLLHTLAGDLVMSAGRSSRVVLADERGRTVTCEYNRRFRGLPTTGQRPDAVIEVTGASGLLIIDAKYRIGRTPEYLARYNDPGPLEEDINVLHRYRDAIVQGVPPYRRLVAAGLIAFPGAATKRARDHRFCRSWRAVWVGGVPMLPGQLKIAEEALAQFLDVGDLE